MKLGILNIINWLSSIISIVCAIISFVFLIKNKTIRNEITDKKNIDEYSNFLSKSNSIIEKIRKYTKKNKIQVFSVDNFIGSLKNYYELIKSVEYNLNGNDLKNIKEGIVKLEHDIQFYSKKDNDVFIKNIDEINKTYFTVVKIQNIIKMNMDKIIY
jgi:hypothetical protein